MLHHFKKVPLPEEERPVLSSHFQHAAEDSAERLKNLAEGSQGDEKNFSLLIDTL